MSLELIIGCMFSGKTTKIKEITDKLNIINANYIVINSNLNNRNNTDNTSTHNNEQISSISLDNLMGFLNRFILYDIIIIDEAQFFTDLYEIVIQLVDKYSKRVIIVGLNGDINRQPFGDIYRLYPLADKVTLLKAICYICKDGTDGIFTTKVNGGSELIDIGGLDKYIPVCRKCYINKI